MTQTGSLSIRGRTRTMFEWKHADLHLYFFFKSRICGSKINNPNTDVLYLQSDFFSARCPTHLLHHVFTGTSLRCEDDQSPLHCLEQAAAHYASAVRLSRREARLHFLLGLVLEEQHHATEMYGLRRKVKTVKSRCVQASPIYIYITDYIYIYILFGKQKV